MTNSTTTAHDHIHSLHMAAARSIRESRETGETVTIKASMIDCGHLLPWLSTEALQDDGDSAVIDDRWSEAWGSDWRVRLENTDSDCL